VELIYRNQSNILIFIVLIFVLTIACKKLEKNDPLNRSFLLSVTGVMIGLFAESASVFLNGNADMFSIIMNNLFSFIIFAIAPMIAFYFFIFIFHLVFPDIKIRSKLLIIFIFPVAINVILALLSPFFGFFFSVSELGVYSRGPLFLLSAFITYLFLIFGVFLVIFNVKKVMKPDLALILFIGVIPIIGGIIQSLFYGILTMWSSAGIALLMGYLFLQDRMIRLDLLTGVWNRESFYYTYSRKIKMSPDKRFGAIYFDIDNLKFVNDKYGHLEGDKAIKLVIEVIRKVIPFGSVICRLGGDEFIIICNSQTQDEINVVLESIKEQFLINKLVKEKDYKLECSFGADIYTSDCISINTFISRLDKLMYEEKFKKKNLSN